MRKTKNIWDNKLLSMTNYLFLPSSAFLLILTCSLWSFSVTKPAVATTPQPIPTTKVVLTPGMTGSEVQVLQIQLKALGLYEKAIDGQYGISTKNAVIQFQKANNEFRKK